MDWPYCISVGSKAAIEEVTALHNVVDAFDNPDHTPLTSSFFSKAYSRKGFAIETDLLLARTKEGHFVGSGTIFFFDTEEGLTGTLNIRVHPDHRNKGVGRSLFDHLITQAERKKATKIICYVPSYREYTRTFVEHRSFLVDEEWSKLMLSPITTQKAPLKSGVLKIRKTELRREAEDLAILHNEVFKYDTAYSSVDAQYFINMLRDDRYPPDLQIVGHDGDILVAFCIGRVIKSKEDSKNTLIIDGVGVHPLHRHKGYGTEVLCEVLNKAATKGISKAELIARNDSTIDFYTRLGFQERYLRIVYSKRL